MLCNKVGKYNSLYEIYFNKLNKLSISLFDISNIYFITMKTGGYKRLITLVKSDILFIVYDKERRDVHFIFKLKEHKKSKKILNWKPIWNINKTLYKTNDWYLNFYEKKNNLNEISKNQILEYQKECSNKWL